MKRQISVSLALAPFLFEDCKINVIDTPGYADFIAEVEAGLSVADLAVLVVSAVEGVEVQTEEVWRLATELGIPRLVFVNKLDRERADFERTLDQLRDRFGSGIAPLELPIGREAAFDGIADLLTDTAITYSDGKSTTGPIPEDMSELEHRVREALIEGIVVADDEMMERYLEGEVPSTKELEETLAHGVASASVFPVVCGSALTGVGIDRLASLICEIGPSPLDRPTFTVRAGNEHDRGRAGIPTGSRSPGSSRRSPTPSSDGSRSWRCSPGTLRPDTTLYDSRNHAEEKLHALQVMRGKETQPISERTGRRHRRRREAERRPHWRHAGAEEPAGRR